MSFASRQTVGRLLAAFLVAAPCACSAQVGTARHLERADRFFDQKKYREAILEYRNVAESQPGNVRAQQRLGIAHYELRELGQAFGYLQRASELDPSDTEVRWRLGTLQALSGQPEEARRHAEFVLQKDANNLDALALLAETADSPEEFDAAIARVDAVRERVPEREKASRILGSLYLKKKDLVKAEQAFQDAVKAAPQSVEAHTALGTLHLARGQFALAEKEYRAASDASPPGSPARLGLADFYIAQRRPSDARQLLTDVTAKEPDYAPAWLRLAELSIVENKYDEADKTLDAVLKKNPRNTNAQLLRAQVRLVQGKTDEATQLIQRAIKDEPNFAPAHYQLALAQLQSGNQQQARDALRTAVTLAPGFAPAALRLAELNIEGGAPDAAIEDLNKLLQARPGLSRAYELLGAAYMKKGDPARAAEVYQKFQQLVPSRDPRASFYEGIRLRAQGKRAEAKAAFERSLAAAPGAPDPLSQLVEMAFEDNRPDAALEVARKQALAAPRSATVQHALGIVHQRRGEIPQAEAAYRKAVELDPRYVLAHLELGKIYLDTGRQDLSLAEADRALAINPKSADAWQLKGLAQLQKGAVANAQEAFKKALEINPRQASAANNLAWLYSEQGGDPEQALQLAQAAKEAAPDDPHVSDTLGWVLYKRGIYQRALALLKESATKLPDSAEVQFHLGMTHYKLGDKSAARQALSRALELNAAFKGADEARLILTEL
jgi:tetratricopeptide (TPR) repeat protein